MDYIGDLSQQDAQILATYAAGSNRILEFGVGASTQILAQCAPPHAIITSIDTDKTWIERTRANFEKLKIARPVNYVTYDEWFSSQNTTVDLIFDDGIDECRLPFAEKSWPLLRIGGHMLFHDTRRPQDMNNVLTLLKKIYLEVDVVNFNERGSNITVIRKKVKEPYVNWNLVERRSPN